MYLNLNVTYLAPLSTKYKPAKIICTYISAVSLMFVFSYNLNVIFTQDADIVPIHVCMVTAMKIHSNLVREYQQRFRHRHLPHHLVFGKYFWVLPEIGNPAPAKTIRPHSVNIQQEEAVINAVINSPLISTRRIAHNLHITQNLV